MASNFDEIFVAVWIVRLIIDFRKTVFLDHRIKFRLYKMKILHALTDDYLKRRVEFCKW